MLNDDFSDRMLPPTERRRREARQRGEIARSPELTAAAILFAASGVLWTLAPFVTTSLVHLLRTAITSSPPVSLTLASTSELSQIVFRMMATILGPIFLAMLICGILANVTQTGWVWSPTGILPRLRFGSLFSWDRLAQVLGRLCLVAILFGVTWRFLTTHAMQLGSLGLDETPSMLVQPARMLGELCLQLSFSLVLFAFVDYGVRYWRQEQRLKMTVEERRQEQRDESGDPRIKQQRTRQGGRRTAIPTVVEIDRIDAANN
jgi:flagellar biosynthetic protein FlhB